MKIIVQPQLEEDNATFNDKEENDGVDSKNYQAYVMHKPNR